MIGAYLAKTFFTERTVKLTEIVAVKKRTAVTVAENKARCFTAFVNATLKLLSDASAYVFVAFKGFSVNVNLPAYTAVVTAF